MRAVKCFSSFEMGFNVQSKIILQTFVSINVSDTSAVNLLIGTLELWNELRDFIFVIVKIESMLLINFSRRDVFERLGLKFGILPFS